VNAIVDPFTLAMHCGECGALAVDFLHAQDCCAEPAEPPAYRTVIAGCLVLIAMIYLFVLLPWIS
jgi:hypothetical protein